MKNAEQMHAISDHFTETLAVSTGRLQPFLFKYIISYICIKEELLCLRPLRDIMKKGRSSLRKKHLLNEKTEVIVTFLTDDNATTGKRIPGGLKGKVSLPDNYNAPPDDMKDFR